MTKETLLIVCALMFVACQNKGRTATNENTETDSFAQPKDTIFIKLEKSEYSATDTVIRYTLENYTGRRLYGGKGGWSNDFEKFVDGKWVSVMPAVEIGDNLMGYLFNDKVTKCEAELYPIYRLTKGHYRLTKDVTVWVNDSNLFLFAEFDITDNAPKKPTDLRTKVTKIKQGINIDVMEGKLKRQSIDYRYDTEFEPNPSSRRDSVVLRDVTFDGHDDVLIYLGSFGNQGVEYFDCYVFDNSNSMFVHAPTFKDIQNPTVANGCIFSKARESASTYIYERWGYTKGRFTATARLMQRYSADRTCLFDEYLINEKRQKKGLAREQISKFWLDIIN